MDDNVFIELLKGQVEAKVGRHLETPEDFEWLSRRMYEPGAESLSVSTLKRLWGYVPNEHSPRVSTLNILSHLLGFPDFKAFKEYALDHILPDSGFGGGEVVLMCNLKPGSEVVAEWEPDRRLKVTCIARGRFRVVESCNSKLLPGAEFSASFLAVGHPLYAYNVSVSGESHQVYCAARKNGLTNLTVISH